VASRGKYKGAEGLATDCRHGKDTNRRHGAVTMVKWNWINALNRKGKSSLSS